MSTSIQPFLFATALSLFPGVLGCGDTAQETVDANPSSSSDATGSLDDDASSTEIDGGQAATCKTHSFSRELEFDFDGETRSALLAGPEALPERPLALILNFHGYSDSPEAQERYSIMSEAALRDGYIVAYPKGTGFIKGWNGGACCGSASSSNSDDVGFTAALIDEIAKTACIDLDRVYAVGYSNGGFLAHTLACELSDKLAGVASVAGVIGIDTCSPTRAIPLLQIHGSSDGTVPYGGNLLIGYPSVDSTMEDWAVRRGCNASAPTVFFDEGDTTCQEWNGCSAPLARCRVEGGGHTWPGGTAPLIRGKVSEDLDATAMMWQFFNR